MKSKRKKQTIKVGPITLSNAKPFVFISGPCVIENRALTIKIAKQLKTITAKLQIPFIFKASYDKANRTSDSSFRGPGIDEGLLILKEIKETLGVPVLSDVHSVAEVEKAAQVLDILQIPAFLCRQTDLLLRAAQTGKVINIKKGQFLAPWDMGQIIKKVESKGNNRILLTERGVSFGYNTLVSDFRSLEVMKDYGYPVVFDATHSVQQPGGLGSCSGGQNQYVPLLSRCGIAAGCSAVFMEVHPDPGQALSDGPNTLALSRVPGVLKLLKKLDLVIKSSKI